MPFESQAQRNWMYANHPAMAARWESVTPKGKLPEHKSNTKQRFAPSKPSESEESPKPGLPKLQRKNEVKRDFGPLHPSAKSRLKTSHNASTKESDEEDGVEAHNPRGRNTLGLKNKHVLDPLAKRDAAVAHRKKV